MPTELQTSEPLRVTEVEEANGWYKITTDRHPKTLKTNREEGGSAAGRFKLDGTRIIVQYAERNDKPNPHGGFYHDFYWYAAKPIPHEANGGGGDGITHVTQTRPATDPDEAWRIALSVGSERAVQLAPHLQPNQADFPFIWALSYEFAQRIYLTPPPSGPLAPLTAGGGAPGAYDDPGFPGESDDDIPF